MPHNIEKSAFRRGEYVGYAHGVWRIHRFAGGWTAIKHEGAGVVFGRTLADISAALDAFRPAA